MNILIADDEILICEWLEYCIDQIPGCTLVGSAHNGEEGLALFHHYRPDMVLTDIKMPLMGGIELLEAIRKESAETMVVMLTAFSEFDLVRQAMRKGATEFILKTEVDKNTIQQLILRLKDVNANENTLWSDKNWHRQSVIKDMLLQKSLLNSEDVVRLKKQGIHWQEGGFFTVAVWKSQLTQEYLFPEETQIHQIIGFEYSEEIYVLAASLPKISGAKERVGTLSNYLTLMMTKGLNMLGVSRIGSEVEKLPDLITEAVAALSIGFYQNRPGIYNWQKPVNELRVLIDTWNRELQHYYKLYCRASKIDKMNIINEALDYCCQNRVCPIRLVTQFCISVMEDVYNLSIASIPGREDIGAVKQRYHSAIYSRERFQICTDFILEYMDKDSGDGRVLSPGVAKVVEIIKKDYAKGLSLEQLASLVELNPEYLSRIFKEETGFTFTSFITNIRMKKAAGLLMHTNTKVNQIGNQVGYPNVSYFSTLFKKYFGITPFEYRRQYQV